MQYSMLLPEKFTAKHEKDRIESNQFAFGFPQIYLLSTAISESSSHYQKHQQGITREMLQKYLQRKQ